MVMHSVFFWNPQHEGKWHPCQVIVLFLLLYINQNFIPFVIYNKNCASEEKIIFLLYRVIIKEGH